MRGSTKLALGATAAAVLLTLILMASLLLDLLFSILLRRRRRRSPSQASQSRATPASPPPPLSKPLHLPLYGHGVLQVPSSDFLLSVPKLEAAAAAAAAAAAKLAVDQAGNADHFVRICNPIFDEACGLRGVNVNAMDDVSDGTPFETPESSPSCFELEEGMNSEPSPPLKFMKKLPSFLPAASSVVCLVDGRRSLAASVSATETNKVSSSSSSSNSLCFSPSW